MNAFKFQWQCDAVCAAVAFTAGLGLVFLYTAVQRMRNDPNKESSCSLEQR